MSGDISTMVPPDSMPNSEVKRRSADGSVGIPHVRVGRCQTFKYKKKAQHVCWAFFWWLFDRWYCIINLN